MLIDPKNLIVCYQHKQTPGQRALGIVLQVLFCGVLLYLFCTFLALFCWAIDYSLFENIIDRKDIQAIKAVISRYFPLIGIADCLFLLWAFYNWLRFHGHRDRRRTRPTPVSLEETVEFYQLDIRDVRNMRQAKVMTCLFDDDGNIIGVKHDIVTPLVRKQRYRNIEMPVTEKDTVLQEEICA